MRYWMFIPVLLLLMGCGARPTVVVYSPHGPDVLRDYETLFEKAHPGVDVQWLDMGAQDVFNRVSAEQNRPACDVWWGGPAAMFIQAADAGLLAPYRPTWADKVAPEYRDAEDRWYGTYNSPLAILFNTEGLTADKAPQSWDALIAPAWYDRITIRKPLASGTMRTFIGAMIMRAPTEDAGFEWLKKLNANTASYVESPQLLYDHMKRNPDLVTVWLLPDAILQRERNGYPFGYVVPDPTPVITEGIALVKGAPHPDLAREFYEFVTTKEALAQQAAAYAKMPIRTDIDPAMLPTWMSEQPIVPMAMDAKRFAAHEQAWMDRWEREVYDSK